jgi:hypothetical protein
LPRTSSPEHLSQIAHPSWKIDSQRATYFCALQHSPASIANRLENRDKKIDTIDHTIVSSEL